MPQIFGNPITRVEDPRLITGQAVYTGDVTLPVLAQAVIVRSPYAHARISRIQTERARSMPGVLGISTGPDLKAAGFGGIPCA